MATKKKDEQEKQPDVDDNLHKAAKAIGSALGTIALKTGIAPSQAPAPKRGKLAKSAKKRVSRKAKKEAKKNV